MFISLFFTSLVLSGCPKIKLQTDPKVNLTEYIRHSWYIQQQQVNGYQSLDDLYCVTATYNKDNNSHVPFFKGNVISVYNYGNYKKVNGESMGSGMVLCARQRNESQPEKLIVAPCFLPNIFSGPYWIVSAGPFPDNYSWAVVSGGQPSEQITNTTCTTKELGVNGSGLWIFSRDKIMNPELLNYIRLNMTKNGIDTSKLINVSQSGCNYSGAFLK